MTNFSHFSLSSSVSFFKIPPRTGILFLTAALLFLPALASSQAMDAVMVAQKLQSSYENASNMVADFSQTTTMAFSRRQRQGSGTLIFLKPGRMRWDYTAPDFQVLISDGETLSMYFEKNNQMIKSPAKEYLQSDVTYAFFAGTGDLLRDFEIVTPDFDNNQKNTHLLKLIPKKAHPHVSRIHAWITAETFLIERLQIVDHFDTVTDLFFTNVLINSDHYGSREIGDDLFYFTPPTGTEIIEQY